MKRDRNCVCIIHSGLIFPKRKAAAQASPEGKPRQGPYLCLTCAESLQDEVPLRWLEGYATPSDRDNWLEPNNG